MYIYYIYYQYYECYEYYNSLFNPILIGYFMYNVMSIFYVTPVEVYIYSCQIRPVRPLARIMRWYRTSLLLSSTGIG